MLLSEVLFTLAKIRIKTKIRIQKIMDSDFYSKNKNIQNAFYICQNPNQTCSIFLSNLESMMSSIRSPRE
jgi:hypothetical protein